MINLIKYAVFILLLFTGQIGWLFLLAGLLALTGSTHGYNAMYALDVTAASMIHGTKKRTISGISGERAELGSKRYIYQARFIDKLAKLFGDDENHCYRAWQDEKLLEECKHETA